MPSSYLLPIPTYHLPLTRYPTVLGANIGTCITGVLAALAADASKLYLTLQAPYLLTLGGLYSHLLVNLTLYLL